MCPHNSLHFYRKKKLGINPEKQIRILKINLILAFVLIIVLFSFTIYLVLENIGFMRYTGVVSYRYDSSETNVTITFDDLNQNEIDKVSDVVKDIKIMYLTKQKSIIFTHNISKYYRGELDADTVLGYNRDRVIYVLYDSNRERLADTICHELLHSYMLRDDDTHDLVYDIAGYGVCYE
jgi:hypothetical protein